MGFSLFDRRKGRLHPTLEALEFFNAVEENFLGFEKLEFIAEQIRTKQPKQLKISCTPSLASTLLPLVIKAHCKVYPDDRIIIYTDNIYPLINKLQAHAVDLAIGLELPDLVGINSENIGKARYVFASHKDHPLAQKEVINPEDLIGENVISTISERMPNYWEKIEASLEGVKDSLHQMIGIDSGHTGYSMIAAGLAVGISEPFSASVWESKGVVTRPYGPEVYYNYDLAYPTGVRKHKSLHSFAETVRQVAKEMPEFNVV